MDLPKICGTCASLEIPEEQEFVQRLRVRFRSNDPFCKLLKKICSKNDSPCFGHKFADNQELIRRGYVEVKG